MNAWVEKLSAPAVLAERRLLFLLELFRQLKARDGTAIIADAPGGLYEVFAHIAGLRVQRYPSRMIVERFGSWVEAWLNPACVEEALPAPEVQTAYLAGEAGRLAYRFPVEAGLDVSPPPDITVQMMPLRSALLNSRNPVLVALNDCEAVAALIQQGSGLLSTLRPVLLLSLYGVPKSSVEALFSLLAPLGYRFCNEQLEPLNPRDNSQTAHSQTGTGQTGNAQTGNAQTDTGQTDKSQPKRSEWLGALHCIAAHPDVVKLPDGHECDTLLELAHSPNQLEVLHGKARLFDYTAKSAEWVRAAIVEEQWRLPLDVLSSQNWYPVECMGEHCWRWLGPGAEARMLIPVPAPGEYLVELRFQAEMDVATVKSARFFLNSELVPVEETDLQLGQLIQLPFAATAENWNGWLELLIAVPGTERASAQDARLLGISLNQLSLRWGGL